MRNLIGKQNLLTAEERRQLKEWLENTGWTALGRYAGDEEYLSYVMDILEHPVFQSMERYIQHGQTTCRDHCIRVSYLTYRICRRMGWNSRESARAGLLHDLFLYDWHTHGKMTGERFHGFTHPRTAMNNAEKYFEVTENQKNMILRHMWPLTPIPPATKEGMALCLADKACSLAEVGDGIRENQWVCRLAHVLHGAG